MSTTLKDALAKAGVALTEQEEHAVEEERVQKHRSKTVVERPVEQFNLSALTSEEFERKKYQKDPTDDLVVVPLGMTEDELSEFMTQHLKDIGGFLVWCADTLDCWFAPTKLCLDQNFIYREDLVIKKANLPHEFSEFYNEYAKGYNGRITTRKKCYILDNPAGETYEVYYDSSYPSLKYGKATPDGMFVERYPNRFHRDMAIMELDKFYADSSKKTAGEFTRKKLQSHQAIIVSDGAWLKDCCSCAHYYLDSGTLIKMSQAMLPSEGTQAVLIAEIQGARNALEMCYLRGKKDITYYYDNISIVNVFRNRKTEYIEEVKEYKELLEKLDAEGFNVTFVELHPKTGEQRVEMNKALAFFHNYCDKECREMADIFKKDYRSIAQTDDASGKTFKDVKRDFAAKKPQNNSKNGQNRYQRKRP